MAGNGTEKLEKYSRTGGSKKAATNAAAEAIALSGHCVGFVQCSSWTALAYNPWIPLRRSFQSVVRIYASDIWLQGGCKPIGEPFDLATFPTLYYLGTDLCFVNVLHTEQCAFLYPSGTWPVGQTGGRDRGAGNPVTFREDPSALAFNPATCSTAPIPPLTKPVPGLHSVVNMSDAELLAYCGQQLTHMRCVR